MFYALSVHVRPGYPMLAQNADSLREFVQLGGGSGALLAGSAKRNSDADHHRTVFTLAESPAAR
jgi:hypothetical protein